MICLKCGSKLGVADTRSDNNGVYRRRKCPKCLRVYYTSEFISDNKRYNMAVSRAKLKI